VHYHSNEGAKFRVLACKGPKAAADCLTQESRNGAVLTSEISEHRNCIPPASPALLSGHPMLHGNGTKLEERFAQTSATAAAVRV